MGESGFGAVELAALGVAEIVLVLHRITSVRWLVCGIHPALYCSRSRRVAGRAEIKRTSAVTTRRYRLALRYNAVDALTSEKSRHVLIATPSHRPCS